MDVMNSFFIFADSANPQPTMRSRLKSRKLQKELWRESWDTLKTKLSLPISLVMNGHQFSMLTLESCWAPSLSNWSLGTTTSLVIHAELLTSSNTSHPRLKQPVANPIISEMPLRKHQGWLHYRFPVKINQTIESSCLVMRYRGSMNVISYSIPLVTQL